MNPELTFIRRATLALAVGVILGALIFYWLATVSFKAEFPGDFLSQILANGSVVAAVYLLAESFLWQRVMTSRSHPMVNSVFRNVQSYWTEYSDNLAWSELLKDAREVELICRWFSGVPQRNLNTFRDFFRRGGRMTVIVPNAESTITRGYLHFGGNRLPASPVARCGGLLHARRTAGDGVDPASLRILTTSELVGHGMMRIDGSSIYIFLYSPIVPEPDPSPVIELAHIGGASSYFETQWDELEERSIEVSEEDIVAQSIQYEDSNLDQAANDSTTLGEVSSD